MATGGSEGGGPVESLAALKGRRPFSRPVPWAERRNFVAVDQC
jgi:hypothetical protein